MSSDQFRLRPPVKLKLTENDVETQCLDLLRVRGWYPIRLQSGLFKTPDGRWIKIGEPGLPDYVAIHARHPAFLIEKKRPHGKPSGNQTKKIWELTRAYGLAVVIIDSLEQLIIWVRKHEQEKRNAAAVTYTVDPSGNRE